MGGVERRERGVEDKVETEERSGTGSAVGRRGKRRRRIERERKGSSQLWLLPVDRTDTFS
jgi:hypothetical protein